MFKQAVKQHHQANVPPRKAPIQQQSLDTVILPTTTATRPLANNSGNVAKYHSAAAASRPPPGTARGIKRTSSGLAKVLCDQEDAFEFSNSAASEEDSPTHSYTSVAPKPPANQPAVFFDEDDFDSDNDLDLEDPASIGTIQYPKLPVEQHVGKSVSEKPNVLPPPAFDVDALVPPKRDSGYKSLSSRSSVLQPRPAYTSIKNEPTERTSLPVASARAEVASTKEKKDPPRTSRRKLPWNTEETTQAKDNVDRNASVVSKSKGDKLSRESTARAETTLNSAYLWNTTASAMKEQQKNLRMANKKMTKSNEGTEEEIQQAVTKRRKNNLPRIFLSEEQQHVLNLVIEHKKSVFFTGSAGTGKSVLLREIISSLRKKYHREPDRVAVTASTGLAACNVGGVTLHSFAGIGLGKEHVDDLVKKIRKNQKAKQRWLRTKVLVVDEVSMVDGELFDKLEHIARTLRNNGRPFGGIQLVITGDFFQLPPVPDSGKIAKFAFDAATWNTTIEYTIGLHHIFRQKDPVFANMLNEMREGRLTSASIAAFSKLDRPLPHIEALKDIEATELFPTRQEVDRANSLRMQQLHGQVYHFEARDGGTVLDKAFRAKLLQNCIAPEKVSLKKGAQVMLIKNIDETLVNGSLGRVRGFMNEQMFADYKDNEDAFLNEGEQDAEAKAWQKAEILGLSTQAVYPVVRFALANGTTRDLLCQRESWKVELPNGEVQASREQVPLILAWALSIHKAQGQTLERVRVDLGRVFEKGQAYVALSRATSINGLQVLRFDAKKVIAHEKVRSFYNSLQRAEQAASSKKAKRQRTLAANDYEQNFVTHDDGEEDYNLSAANAMG